MSSTWETILDAQYEMSEYGAIRYEAPKAIWLQLEEAIRMDNKKAMHKIVKGVAPKVDVGDDQIVDIAKRVAFHDKVQGQQRHYKRVKYLTMKAVGEAFAAVSGYKKFPGAEPKDGVEFSPVAYAAAAIVILTLQRRGVGGKHELGVCDPQLPRNANRFRWPHMPTPHYEAWAAWDAAMEEAIIDCAELLRSYSIEAVNDHGPNYDFEKEQDEIVTILDACLRRRPEHYCLRLITWDEIVDVYLAAIGYNSHVPWPELRLPYWVAETYSVAETEPAPVSEDDDCETGDLQCTCCGCSYRKDYGIIDGYWSQSIWLCMDCLVSLHLRGSLNLTEEAMTRLEKMDLFREKVEERQKEKALAQAQTKNDEDS